MVGTGPDPQPCTRLFYLWVRTNPRWWKRLRGFDSVQDAWEWAPHFEDLKGREYVVLPAREEPHPGFSKIT